MNEKLLIIPFIAMLFFFGFAFYLSFKCEKLEKKLHEAEDRAEFYYEKAMKAKQEEYYNG